MFFQKVGSLVRSIFYVTSVLLHVFHTVALVVKYFSRLFKTLEHT